MSQPGFFAVDERLASLSAAGDPLERLSAVLSAAETHRRGERDDPRRRHATGLVQGQTPADLDARWTIRRGRSKRSEANEMQAPAVQIAVPVFGYDHAGIGRRHGLIRRWTVTSAAAHDRRPFEGLLDPKNTASKVWAPRADEDPASDLHRHVAGEVAEHLTGVARVLAQARLAALGNVLQLASQQHVAQVLAYRVRLVTGLQRRGAR